MAELIVDMVITDKNLVTAVQPCTISALSQKATYHGRHYKAINASIATEEVEKITQHNFAKMEKFLKR
ncbi:hypothetical protein BBBOND_0207050 [Babesia bigemina]|uniref:Uncharacterized protein n=1 Tax=Babesia bigemina TaxID=5866 RepID=A0A061D6A5_BABBI|nr:hypothetical protein BBBOND_0207050 [Babesia bigemina]CDR95547.1 hypothetical protein BBBOND_0207050 [Babesia bigemina]|eukprot:XP_012767733.1 hypothetical protein BBBOND_0207050 [Babesia bigemina]